MKILLLTLIYSSVSLAGTIIPFERENPRVEEYYFLTSRHTENYSINFAGDEEENIYAYGFSISNFGPNDIVPEQPYSLKRIERQFSFVTDDGSQRENYLWITDSNGSGYNSDLFETLIVFLPRLNQMHIEETNTSLLVTLSTGEEVLFNKKHKAIMSGVLGEAPVDLTPDRSQRKFAGIKYFGKGIMIRSDSRAADPRLGKNLEVVKAGLAPCRVPKETFWTQTGYPQFKFVNDEDAYAVIKEKCGLEYLP